MEYVAFDSHKRYTWASVQTPSGRIVREEKIPHSRGALRAFLAGCEPGSPVAVETIGSWYWIVDEIEEAGLTPRLVHARKAKLMMAMTDKTDKLDARGLNRLQRSGTLPAVWIPPGELRDRRDLPRTRMVLVKQRTQLKNRLHAVLAKYALAVEGASDLFGRRARGALEKAVRELPDETRYATERTLEQIDALGEAIKGFEVRMGEAFEVSPEVGRLMTLPGVGFILATVLAVEIGEVGRFGRAAKLASYAGTTPRVHASGGKVRYGRLRPDVNRYLKWALVEAANSVARNRRHWPGRHVVRLYERLRRRKGHAKAVGAVARHLAEAAYWVLTKKEAYREPGRPDSSTKA